MCWYISHDGQDVMSFILFLSCICYTVNSAVRQTLQYITLHIVATLYFYSPSVTSAFHYRVYYFYSHFYFIYLYFSQKVCTLATYCSTIIVSTFYLTYTVSHLANILFSISFNFVKVHMKRNFFGLI